MKKFLLIFIYLFLFSCGPKQVNYLAKAQRYKSEKKYDLAINSYEIHLKKRLAFKKRPKWENPYVYYLEIGDIYFIQDRLDEALKYYLLAEEQKVEVSFISDRLRQIASWYEERGKLAEAIAHLQKYQDRDPDLFNMMLDRLAKQVAKEP